MRKFAYAAVFAAAISAPVLAGALDHSVVSVLGAPETGSCNGGCNKGAAGVGGESSDGKAQGGFINNAPDPDSGTSVAGSLGGAEPQAGHVHAFTTGFDGSFSGNFTDPLDLKGNCAGDFIGTVC